MLVSLVSSLPVAPQRHPCLAGRKAKGVALRVSCPLSYSIPISLYLVCALIHFNCRNSARKLVSMYLIKYILTSFSPIPFSDTDRVFPG